MLTFQLSSYCCLSLHGTRWQNIWILLYVAFCTIMVISRQKEARSRDYALLLFRMTSRILYSAQYHRQYCTLQAFEQFRALYMHNHDDKYPARAGFEPGTSRLQAPVDTNEPPGRSRWQKGILSYKDKQQWLLTCKVSSYCCLSLHGGQYASTRWQKRILQLKDKQQ